MAEGIPERTPERSLESEVARIQVRLTPRAGREVVGPLEGEGEQRVLRVRVTAAPVGGQANDALVRLLAKRLRVGRTSVRIVSGATSVRKVVAVDGVTTEEALRRLL